MTRTTKRVRQHVTAAILAVFISVAFAGTPSAQSDGNSQNHHVLPRTIEIKAGGVVNFAVA